MEAHAARPQWLFACQRACFIVALPYAQRWLAERGFMLIAPLEKCIIARRGGRCLAVVLASIVESPSWPEWLERPPAMVWL
jgi:hypothetical protein